MWRKLEELLLKYLRKEIVFMKEDDKQQPEMEEQELKEIHDLLKQADIQMEEGLKLLDGNFLQYRKLIQFFAQYQQDNMDQVEKILKEKDKIQICEFTRMMHTLKSNAKAIGADSLFEIAREFEIRGKQEDIEYIISGYPLLKLEWNRAYSAAQRFLHMTQKEVTNDSTKKNDNNQSKEEAKERLKIFITRYQAKEAKEQIQHLLENQMTNDEKDLLKQTAEAIDQLDFEEAEILLKRWEGIG